MIRVYQNYNVFYFNKFGLWDIEKLKLKKASLKRTDADGNNKNGYF